MPVIKVENLSKKYILSHQSQERYTALRDVMSNGVKNLGRKLLSPFTPSTSFGSAQDMSLRAGLHPSQSSDSPFTASEDFYALRDVSFEIKQGDRVGIIGRNGAGKSTLLKILSRITEPTSGRIEITGRVASLLEVGTGFHPELTGRENIFLNGAILGMGRVEIKRKFDEIVAFAEIEKFLDTPVKRYSSGMYVRLAFAVAAHMEPEILIVDEVLAVGDAQFQKKCLGKMKDVSTKEGRTVLFVSHNMNAVTALTSVGLVLQRGHVVFNGSSLDAVSNYISSIKTASDDNEVKCDSDYINNVKIIEINHVCKSGSSLNLLLELEVMQPFKFNVEGWIKDLNEYDLLFFAEGQTKKVLHQVEKGTYQYNLLVEVPFLAEGEYFLYFSLSEPYVKTYAGTVQPIRFEVIGCDPADTGFSMTWGSANRGCICVDSGSTLKKISI